MTTISLPTLNHRFATPDSFRSRNGGHRPLPIRFTSLDRNRYVATNMAGELLVLSRGELDQIGSGRIENNDQLRNDLLRKHFIMDDTSEAALDLLSVKVRTKYAWLEQFTALHLFVVTLRCDHSCPYCQVSRVSSDKTAFDMSLATADRAVEFLFRSPNPYLKVEFQGGESLLNFDLIRHVVMHVEERNQSEQRRIEFVIATNLSPMTDEMLRFCQDHRIWISTSLDGPRELHNSNRPRPNHDSYERTIAGIDRCRSILGPRTVSALMTTTKRSLDQPEAIIDEYVKQGFDSIFLRWLSPFGFASKTGAALGYRPDEWNQFYERGLRYIISLNQAGGRLREEYARLILRKMLTPYPTGYVDLQSPSGLGISVVVYNYDGDVYASDEARMLAETGDKTFRLGNLHSDRYEDVFLSDRLLNVLDQTMTEGTPRCSDCAFEPYCGTDPVLHHATQGDMVGHRPTSIYCHRNMFVFRLLVRLMEDDSAARDVLRGWV